MLRKKTIVIKSLATNTKLNMIGVNHLKKEFWIWELKMLSLLKIKSFHNKWKS